MKVTAIPQASSAYPKQLRQLTRPPTVLYHQGRDLRDIVLRPRVAVVGSRRITPYGRQITRQLTRELVEQGIVIVSGLAYGVDAEAHATALEAGGITIAVLPTPVEKPAPYGNRRLAANILEQGGALVSTYAAGNINHKGNFVERNEIVAALSDAVIVTEAAEGSGTISTANFAQDLNVPVFAVPGPLTSPLSVGAHQLIKANKAAILTSITDVLYDIGVMAPGSRHHKRPVALAGKSPEQQTLLSLLVNGVDDGDELLEQSGLPITTFNQTLSLLEITGVVMALGANRWGLP